MTRDLALLLNLYRQTMSDAEQASDVKVFPITGSAHEQAWRRICQRAKIGDLHFHDLRHTAATSFAVKPIELSVRENAYMLGHGYGDFGRMTRVYENPEIRAMVESIRAKLEAADELFDNIDTLEDIALYRQFSLDPSILPDPTPEAWPELEWIEKDGKIIMDLNGPNTRKYLEHEAAEAAHWKGLYDQLEQIVGAKLPLMEKELVLDLLKMEPAEQMKWLRLYADIKAKGLDRHPSARTSDAAGARE